MTHEELLANIRNRLTPILTVIELHNYDLPIKEEYWEQATIDMYKLLDLINEK